MAHGFERKSRVADHLKHELGRLLLSHSFDPRFKFVSITAIELSKDYAHATVYVTILNDSQVKDILIALNKAAGFFRRELAQRVNLRTTPQFHFQYDESIRRGEKITKLLSQKPSEEEE